MIVGFIGFGEVSSTLSNILSKNGVKTVTVVKPGESDKFQAAVCHGFGGAFRAVDAEDA